MVGGSFECTASGNIAHYDAIIMTNNKIKKQKQMIYILNANITNHFGSTESINDANLLTGKSAAYQLFQSDANRRVKYHFIHFFSSSGKFGD